MDFFAVDRLKMIRQAHCHDSSPNFHLWNLRGHSSAIEHIRPQFYSRLKNSNYSLLIIDPVYKTLGDRDENSAGQINSLMNEFTLISEELNVAVVIATHHAKGDSKNKSAVDRTSGSGVFGRDPDTIASILPTSQPEIFEIDAVFRNHKDIGKFHLQWDFPLFTRINTNTYAINEN